MTLVFTIVYAIFVTANYVVQLTTVIPAKLEGALEAIRVLEQTPHSRGAMISAKSADAGR